MNVLLVPAHPGFPGQIPQSRKTVVCVCVCLSIIYKLINYHYMYMHVALHMFLVRFKNYVIGCLSYERQRERKDKQSNSSCTSKIKLLIMNHCDLLYYFVVATVAASVMYCY